MPAHGDWSLMRKHILTVICAGRADLCDYWINWLARMVQFPERPAETSLVMRGPKGAGKSILGYWLRRLCGQHGITIFSAEHLTGRFNGHLRDCILLFADEAFYAGDRRHESILKGAITEQEMVIEAKYLDPEMVVNHLHILQASNADWVVPATADERRFCVADTTPDHLNDYAYFAAINQQMEQGGLAAMLHDLLAMDLSKFNHRAVPGTPELNEQKLHSMDTRHRWWLAVLDRSFVWKSRFGHTAFTTWAEFYTTELLVRSYAQWCDENRISHRASRPELGKFFATTYQYSRPRGLQPVYERDSVDQHTPDPVVKLDHQPGYGVGNLDAARAAFEQKLNLDASDLPWRDRPWSGRS
jgi:hypothetical protein